MRRLRVGIWEAPPELEAGSAGWNDLAARVREVACDVFLLNEMPFGPWLAEAPTPDPAALQASIDAHQRGLDRLSDLGARIVLGSRPALRASGAVNEAFVWTAREGAVGVHTKQYFPDEEGYYEARWFQRDERHFRVAEVDGIRVGFLICTEVMFNEHARRYGRDGAHLIAVPRAVGPRSLPRWKVAMRMAAIVSGCYVLSSNRTGTSAAGQAFGGSGWAVTPRGECVLQTARNCPIACIDIDLDEVAVAQADYPCYVAE